MAEPMVEPDIPELGESTAVTAEEQEINGAAHIVPVTQPLQKLSHSSSVAGTGDLISISLRFLSTASNEMLGGIVLALIICTYVVLGRLGLLLIGILAGVMLHASWEGRSDIVGVLEEARKEKGLDINKTVLDWREKQPTSQDNEEADHHEERNLSGMAFEDFRPQTSAALSALVDAVIRDYVSWWYSPIVPTDGSFPTACYQTLTLFIRSISAHLSRKRPADAFLDFLTNSSSIVIVFLSEISSAISVSQGLIGTPAEAVEEYLSTNPGSNLANILNEDQQEKKFKMIAEDILENFLEKLTYQCNPARIFLREILSNVVMKMTLSACSKPEWINGWIVDLLEEGEPEIIQVIDVGMRSTPSERSTGDLRGVSSTKPAQLEVRKHQKRLSRAEEAMEGAMEEAKRLSQLIAEEDEKKMRMLGVSSRGGSNSKLVYERPETPSVTDISQPSFQTIKSNSELPPTTLSGHLPPSTPTVPMEASFTSFDQIVPPSQPTALQLESQTSQKSSYLTLHNANIIIHDNSDPNDKGRIRMKPQGDYMVQIEPKTLPGWITFRKFQDFENLHEILRRIAMVSGVTTFSEQHGTLPDWKMHTKVSLRGELERYLRDACWHQQLAESEGIKRFLEKDQSNMHMSGVKGIGWQAPVAFETMGKGMLDVLANAPKGAAEGSKAVIGGVAGVLGNIGSLGQKKRENTSNLGSQGATKTSATSFSRQDSLKSIQVPGRGMSSDESHTQPSKDPSIERTLGYASVAGKEIEKELLAKGRVGLPSRPSLSDEHGTSSSRDASQAIPTAPMASCATKIADVENINLPPLPSDIPDDYGSNAEASSLINSRTDSINPIVRTPISAAPSMQSSGHTLHSASEGPITLKRFPKEKTPLTEQETRVAVELLFAVINELYTLSSAWNIRRTLLNAAKTFLIRPGNPSLASIQSLIQDSFINSNTSDAAIASQIHKLRENTLPTEEELKNWPSELTTDEKEKLRLKARKLLVERGMPTALTGVMGQGATGEALGRVFDCLQVDEVARGLIFGLLLQSIRAIAH